jgi:hypothetical protein
MTEFAARDSRVLASSNPYGHKQIRKQANKEANHIDAMQYLIHSLTERKSEIESNYPKPRPWCLWPPSAVTSKSKRWPAAEASEPAFVAAIVHADELDRWLQRRPRRSATACRAPAGRAAEHCRRRRPHVPLPPAAASQMCTVA